MQEKETTMFDQEQNQQTLQTIYEQDQEDEQIERSYQFVEVLDYSVNLVNNLENANNYQKISLTEEDKTMLLKKNYGKEKINFNPTQVGDIKQAERHEQAQRVKKITKSTFYMEKNGCECCELPLNGEKFGLNEDLTFQASLDQGIIFYFRFLKFLSFMLLACFIVYGLPCLIDILIRSNNAE